MTHLSMDSDVNTVFQDLQKYIMFLLSQWWILLLSGLFVGAIAFGISKVITPVYETSSTLLIDEASNISAGDYNALLASERLARTYSQLLVEEPVLIETLDRLNQSMPVADLQEIVTSRRVPDTQLIELTVQHTDPELAALYANTIVAVFIEQTQAIESSRYAASRESLLRELERQDDLIETTATQIQELGDNPTDSSERDRLQTLLAQQQQTYTNLLQSFEAIRIAESQESSNVIQIKPALVPDQPTIPNIPVGIAVGTILGVVIATAGLLIKEVIDDTLKNSDQVERILGLPTLGMIGEFSQNSGNLPTLHSNRSMVAQSFRSLRTNIQYTEVHRELKTILITSPLPKDGKSTITANLAVTIAQNGRSVVVVEADLHQPALSSILGVKAEQGLSDLFLKPLDYLPHFVQKTDTPGVSVLPSGMLPPNPTELLDSARNVTIIETLCDHFDIVLIDSPPVLALADASVLASQVDGILLVIRQRKTRVTAIQEALQQLERTGGNVLGVVLNAIDTRSPGHSGYYYANYDTYFEKDDLPKPGLPRLISMARDHNAAATLEKKPEGQIVVEPAAPHRSVTRVNLSGAQMQPHLDASHPSRSGKKPRRIQVNRLIALANTLVGAAIISVFALYLLRASYDQFWIVVMAASLFTTAAWLLLAGFGWMQSNQLTHIGLIGIGSGVICTGMALIIMNVLSVLTSTPGNLSVVWAVAGIMLLMLGLFIIAFGTIRYREMKPHS